MKKILLLLAFVLSNGLAQAQIYDAKTIKKIFIDDYKEVPDSAIVYPIRGFFLVSKIFNYGYPMSQLEYFVIDAKGQLLYYNSYNLVDDHAIIDNEYIRYMKLQGMHQCKITSARF